MPLTHLSLLFLDIGLDEDIACGKRTHTIRATHVYKLLVSKVVEHLCPNSIKSQEGPDSANLFLSRAEAEGWTCISLKRKYYTNYLESSLLGFINRWWLWLEVKPLTAELMLMLHVSTVIFHRDRACLLTNLTWTWENCIKCVHNLAEMHTAGSLLIVQKFIQYLSQNEPTLTRGSP